MLDIVSKRFDPFIHYALYQDVGYTTSSACTLTSLAIVAAASEIMLGRQDAMITGGSEAVITGLTMAGFSL